METTTKTASARGLIVFAGLMLIITGVWQLLMGIAALVNDTLYVLGAAYVWKFDITTWGWIHTLIGVALLLVGIFLLMGQGWARWTAVVLTSISAVANFAWLPWYPIWSILIIALDAFILWALITQPSAIDSEG